MIKYIQYKLRKWFKLERAIIKTIRRSIEYAKSKQWYEVYWAFDLHGTILVPNHIKGNVDTEFYPYAKEAMQIISNRNDIILITNTSAFDDELESYIKMFDENGIYFKYFNENPEIDHCNGSFGNYDKKFYFNVLFEDKAGFFPEDWYDVFQCMKEYEKYKPPIEWKNKKLKKYKNVRGKI